LAPNPISGHQVVSLSQSYCVTPVELTDGRGGRVGGRSQIIRRLKSRNLYKSFSNLWYTPFSQIPPMLRPRRLPPADISTPTGHWLLEGPLCLEPCRDERLKTGEIALWIERRTPCQEYMSSNSRRDSLLKNSNWKLFHSSLLYHLSRLEKYNKHVHFE